MSDPLTNEEIAVFLALPSFLRNGKDAEEIARLALSRGDQLAAALAEVDRLRAALDAIVRERDEAAAKERAAIVAWLVEDAMPSSFCAQVAGSIAAGEHLAGEWSP